MESTRPQTKILHLLDHSIPLQSGYTFRTQNILTSQRERGWEPIALTSMKHNIPAAQVSGPIEELNGIRFYRVPDRKPEESGVIAQLKVMWSLRRRAREVIEEERPDILHIHSPVLNALPLLLPKAPKGLRVVYEIRAFWEDAAVDHGSYGERSWKYRVVRALETWVCRRVDRIVVICEGLKRDLMLRGIPEEKISIVANGVHAHDFSAPQERHAIRVMAESERKTILGFIGSFYRYEGLDLLVKAFALVSKKRDDLLLYLVGGGEVEAELRSLVSSLGLAEKVVFPGRVPHVQIPAIYDAMNILVYPRKSMRLTELVTPLKPLEAMAVGKAVLASDIGGHRELIENGRTGILFPPDSEEELAAAILQMLAAPDDTADLAKRAQQWVLQERIWPVTTKVYSRVYGLD